VFSERNVATAGKISLLPQIASATEGVRVDLGAAIRFVVPSLIWKDKGYLSQIGFQVWGRYLQRSSIASNDLSFKPIVQRFLKLLYYYTIIHVFARKM